jgi:hypothetical protein
MKSVYSSEMSINFYQTTRRYICSQHVRYTVRNFPAYSPDCRNRTRKQALTPVAFTQGDVTQLRAVCSRVRLAHLTLNGVFIRVGIATGYGLDDRGVRVRVPVGLRTFSSPRRPDRLWSPTNLLYNGYQGLFPRG